MLSSQRFSSANLATLNIAVTAFTGVRATTRTGNGAGWDIAPRATVGDGAGWDVTGGDGAGWD